MLYYVANCVANPLSPRAVADYTRRSRSDNPMARARHGSYLFQRPGSANWYVKLRSPGERANAQLKAWRILHKLRCCPWRAGQLAKAIHALHIHGA